MLSVSLLDKSWIKELVCHTVRHYVVTSTHKAKKTNKQTKEKHACYLCDYYIFHISTLCQKNCVFSRLSLHAFFFLNTCVCIFNWTSRLGCDLYGNALLPANCNLLHALRGFNCTNCANEDGCIYSILSFINPDSFLLPSPPKTAIQEM